VHTIILNWPHVYQGLARFFFFFLALVLRCGKGLKAAVNAVRYTMPGGVILRCSSDVGLESIIYYVPVWVGCIQP